MGKFRGNKEDWLDDQKSVRRSSKASRPPKRSARDSDVAQYISEDEANATIIEVYPQLARALLDAGGERLCSFRRAAILGAKANDTTREGRDRSPVAVGDRVRVDSRDSHSGLIDGLCARRNELVRPAPGRDGGALFHVLAANVDWVVIVASAARPDFSPGLVDRFLVTAVLSGLSAMLVVTKVDLLDDAGVRAWDVYRALGYPVFEVSTPARAGVESLRAALEQKTSVFCGHSGVGKTTLLNAIVGASQGRVGEVSDSGKGKHTTSSAIMISVDARGTRTIDTPGVKDVSLGGLTPEQIASAFPELADAGCAAARCLHGEEEGCAARALPRYASYRRMVESLAE